MNSLKAHKHAILLAALVWVVLVQSLSHRDVLGPVLSDLTLAIVMMLVFLVVFYRRSSRLLACIALAIAIVADWVHYALPGSAELPLRLIYHSAVLLLVGFATIVILRNIFQQHVVRTDDVLGAVCGYLLASEAWSHLFMLIEIFLPESFSVSPGFSADLDSWHGRIAVTSYVSLGSLTSIGSGTVMPVRPPATILTTLEAVFGQFYIAVVVAQLVSARLSHALQRNSLTQA
ncbi:MAG TPA: hypothetical protein VI585_17395 [Candidatus Binatia bacterium]